MRAGWLGRRGVAGVVLVAGLAGAGLLVSRELRQRRAAHRALPTLDGTLEASGLEQRVSIVRDGRGMPHIRAESERDAIFALGFVHAQDRLAQMEWLRRSARGRLAEVVGSEALAGDRLARTLGIGRHADEQAARLDPRTRRALEAYAAGVNARIARVRAGRVAPPVPLAGREVPLEDWSPSDSLAVERLIAWSLDGSLDASLVLSDLIERLGGFGARPFFPPGAPGEMVPLPDRPPVEARSVPAPTRELDPLRRATGLAGRSIGSSAWLVSGAITERGRPLLAGDLHLEPTTPSLLYEAHWSAPHAEVAGVTIPGVPVFWSGHNARVAWIAVHAPLAVTDLYWETVDGDPPDRYRAGPGWRSIVAREESIAVRGAEPETLTVRETAHGPLVDRLVGPDRAPLAVAWSGAQPGDGMGALLRAARAKDAAAFRRALGDLQLPVLCFLYADAAGAGGLQVAGWVPRRAMTTGLVPVPGRSGWYDWRGGHGLDDLPHASLDGSSWLVAADGGLAGEPAGPERERLDWWWRPGERQRRIEALLRESSAAGPLTVGGMVAIQNDVQVGAAAQRVRALLNLAGDTATLPLEARSVVDILEGWGGGAESQSVGAVAWHVLVDHVLHETLARPLGPDLLDRYLSLRGVTPELLLDRLLEVVLAPEPDPEAVIGVDELREAVRGGLRQTGLWLRVQLGADSQGWQWGRVHQLRFRSFGWPEASWLAGGGPLAEPYGGDGVTVSVGEYDARHPYDVSVISAYRLVVDLANPEIALSTLASRPSEHEDDARFDSGLARWQSGRPSLLATHPLVVEETARARLVLEPAAAGS